MNQKVLYKVFIWGFLFLYLLVAGISFCHAVEFFNIGNPTIMAGTLAFAFELGLSLSLAAILLSDANKRQTLPWCLMIVLTAVQVIGNVYSTFKHIALSNEDYYVYLQKPLLFWIEEVSQDTVQIIISWIIGAILPIVALAMTDMVASNIRNLHEHNTVTVKEEHKEDHIVETPVIEEKHEDPVEEINEPTVTPVEPEKPIKEEPIQKNEDLGTETKITDVKVNDGPIISIDEGSDDSTIINKRVEKVESQKEDHVLNRPTSSVKKVKIEPIPTGNTGPNIHKADDPYFESPEKIKEG